MKEKTEIYLKIAVLVILIVGGIYWAKGAFFPSLNGAAVATGDGNLRQATVELPGMFCAACAWSSENTIKGIPGVVDANIDIGVKKGTVIYDPSIVTKEQLVEPGLIKAYEGKVIDDQPYNE